MDRRYVIVERGSAPDATDYYMTDAERADAVCDRWREPTYWTESIDRATRYSNAEAIAIEDAAAARGQHDIEAVLLSDDGADPYQGAAA